ncbi:predicted protein [Plenodomus lingam JN3]|uniref:Predicted protein n=1 Tax=Leptosphaeria maculans (strain JN3 / isolate v23.1.3 / race Av1-4-5-6-7-8) TaxID=985895 RepID=E5A3V0_LEPMJ|nr:predicted protein [Plenodomus lingam JN3]CBX97974.1 predicted protein [Plenodomus lingam JN3]
MELLGIPTTILLATLCTTDASKVSQVSKAEKSNSQKFNRSWSPKSTIQKLKSSKAQRLQDFFNIPWYTMTMV